MSSLIVLLGWILDALSLKSWSDAIFARFAGPSDGDYPVHRAIWVMCRDGRYQNARRLASSRWEWTKSLRVGRDLVHVLLRLGEFKRAIEIADQMASQDANNPWLRILAADLHRFFGKDEDKALAMYLDAMPACEAMLPHDQALAVVYERLTAMYRKRGDTLNLAVSMDRILSISSSDLRTAESAGKAIHQGSALLPETAGVRRIPVAIGLLSEASGPVEAVVKWVKRRVRSGDTVSISSPAAAIMQGRMLMEGTVPVSPWARFMARCIAGTDPMARPLTVQAAIEEVGALKILVAVLAGVTGKLLKTNGWFYAVAGPSVAQIVDTLGSAPPYDYYVIAGPSDASALSDKIAGELGEGIRAAVVGNQEQTAPVLILRPEQKTKPQGAAHEQDDEPAAGEEPQQEQPDSPEKPRSLVFAGLFIGPCGPCLKAVAKGVAWIAAAATVAGESTVHYTKTVLANPRTRGVAIASVLVVTLGASGLAWLDRPVPIDVPVPVLLYHDLTTEAVSHNGMVIPAHEFRIQMALLRECGYESISASQLEAHLTGKGTLPNHPILITFDDGYESVYTIAYPVLREFGLRATAFVVGTTVRTPNHLTFGQMREMSAAGVVEIGSHTYAGHGGSAAAPEIASWTEEQVMADLSTLTAVLRAEKVPMVPAFAYPFGNPSLSLVSAVRKLGFTIAFTTENGMASRTLSLLTQRRVTMWPGGDGALFLRRIEPSFWLDDDEEQNVEIDVVASR